MDTSQDIIDVDSIVFSNDETWLYKPSATDMTQVHDLQAWLYQDLSTIKDIDYHKERLSLIRQLAKIDADKIIDSRTFTRPKKRTTVHRPSIEIDNKLVEDNLLSEGSVETTSETLVEEPVPVCNDFSQTPLKFDLSQPVNVKAAFDSIAVGAAEDVDSFMNMSPPSLVNSMCSSTFANLMENSYIQNDPILREIRDSDVTEEVMLQDCEPSLLKSMTDSCTSINSDTPEGFLKKSAETTFRNIYKKNVLSSDKENIFNGTFVADDNIFNSTYSKESNDKLEDNLLNEDFNKTQTILPHIDKRLNLNKSLDSSFIMRKVSSSPPPLLNGTFRKSHKLNATFEKLSRNNSVDEDLNRTITIVEKTNQINSIKRRSYVIDNRSANSSEGSPKRNSLACSVGSCDSLDYTSSLSNSSKGSNKMLNMAEVDALVLQQEQSLPQVMSTPKPTSKLSQKVWETNAVSPIVNLDGALSDSESSNEDYRTIGSNSSSTRTTPHDLEARQLKSSSSSLDNAQPTTQLRKPGTLKNPKNPTSNLKTIQSALKSSYTNLNAFGYNPRGSQSNLAQLNFNNKPKPIGTYTSNLKSMSANLKASYTQLKPVLNLGATAVDDLASSKLNSNNTFKQPGLAPLRKAASGIIAPSVSKSTTSNIATALKPQLKSSLNNIPQPKLSGLPRPVSSIPRATVSKIPAPRTDRKGSKTISSQSVSKVDIEGDF